MITSVLYSWIRCWISPRSMGYRLDPLPNRISSLLPLSFIHPRPPLPHLAHPDPPLLPCPTHAPPPMPHPSHHPLQQRQLEIYCQKQEWGESQRAYPGMSAKQVSKQYIIRSLSVWGHSEDSTKHSHKQQLLDIQQLKQITDSTTATRQLSSLKPNDESRRKGNKERRKWKQAMTHFSSVYSLLFYEIVIHAWTWWRWWKVVKEPA